jgi:phosphohistidine phosphatase SixA
MQPEEACALLRESPAQEARVLLVGHNPDLEALVSYLLETSAAGIEMKTASLAHITADPPARGRGLLRALVPVKRIEQG